MFLPEVTNSRLPTTLAPVVSPTSCLSEPRYSTLLDITASGSGGTAAAAGAARASEVSRVRQAARRVRISPGSNAPRCANLRSVGGDGQRGDVVARLARLGLDRGALHGGDHR